MQICTRRKGIFNDMPRNVEKFRHPPEGGPEPGNPRGTARPAPRRPRWGGRPDRRSTRHQAGRTPRGPCKGAPAGQEQGGHPPPGAGTMHLTTQRLAEPGISGRSHHRSQAPGSAVSQRMNLPTQRRSTPDQPPPRGSAGPRAPRKKGNPSGEQPLITGRGHRAPRQHALAGVARHQKPRPDSVI